MKNTTDASLRTLASAEAQMELQALRDCVAVLEHFSTFDAVFKRRKEYWARDGAGGRALYEARKVLQHHQTAK